MVCGDKSHERPFFISTPFEHYQQKITLSAVVTAIDLAFSGGESNDSGFFKSVLPMTVVDLVITLAYKLNIRDIKIDPLDFVI